MNKFKDYLKLPFTCAEVNAEFISGISIGIEYAAKGIVDEDYSYLLLDLLFIRVVVALQ